MPERPSALTYVGHATVLIELAGRRLITDPLLGGVLHVRRRPPAPRLDDLLPLDAILISHAHRDHLDHRSLSRLDADCPTVVPRGCAPVARRAGAQQATELDVGGRIEVAGVVVEGIHAAHGGRRDPFSSPMASLGYLLHGPQRIYFAGDTDLFAGMADLAGRVDVALLPIWGWGPRLPSGHLDPARAAQAVALIRPRLAIPIHWGTLRAWGAQRGLDPRVPARAFADGVMRVAPDTEVRVLMPGDRTLL
ncbi:MAG TPA: MBL fold metallo-hydrolase [Solirubrobacteraceae bacterium]